MPHILVVEDDVDLNRTVCTYLGLRGHACTAACGAAQAYDALYQGDVDLIVLDIMMPGTDGFELAGNVRAFDPEIPIIFMTARDDLPSKRRGFAAGADDYLVKPIDLEELSLHVGACLRRAGIRASRRLEVGDVTLDSDEHAAYVAGSEVPLTAREFDLLKKFLSYPKKTFTRAQLMNEFWDPESQTSPRTVDVYVTKLRQKFAGTDAFEIVTVHGLGYKAVTHV